jgi:hypothetical protein
MAEIDGPDPFSPTLVNLRDPVPQSPEWWLLRLLKRLDLRGPVMRRYAEYYDGIQPLAFASEKFRSAFGTRLRAFSSNFMALVVDGTVERMQVQGFRFKDETGDDDLWDIWQENDMDGQSLIAHTEALIKGLAYALVEPAVSRKSPPLITVEDARNCIVEHDPRNRRERRAGLKRWLDDENRLVIFLYLPTEIYKFISEKPMKEYDWPNKDNVAPARLRLMPMVVDGEDWPLKNTIGQVPLVTLPNRPRLGLEGQSEIAPVINNQDAINKYRADALVAAEFAAFRQRWVIGMDIPVDPDTGKPVEPFKSAIDRLWMVPPADPENPNPPEVKFGEFEATDLAPYKMMIESEVGAVSSIARMPYHYLLGQPQAIPPSGESLKSSEAGLVAKVKRAEIYLGEGWEEVMRLSLRAMNDKRATLRTAETIWMDPETRQESSRVDGAIKLRQQGVLDDDGVLEYIGMSPQAIARAAKRREAAKLEGVPGPVPYPPAPPAEGEPPVPAASVAG